MSTRPETTYSARFAAAVLDPERPEPDIVSGPSGKAAVKRFNVYRNNVTYSLVSALADIFPATAKVLGDENFRAIARQYVRQEPPHSRLLFEYGYGFADFLERFEPIRHLAYLPDLARLERAWLDAYHAADAAPLSGEAIAAVPPEKLGDTVFLPHPATRIVPSRFAVLSIFNANRGDAPRGRINAAVAEATLITRPQLNVTLRLLDTGLETFLHALMAGKTLQQAAEQAADACEAFDLAAAIGTMVESGAFHGVTTAEQTA